MALAHKDSTRLAATQANRKAAQRMADDLEDTHQKKALKAKCSAF